MDKLRFWTNSFILQFSDAKAKRKQHELVELAMNSLGDFEADFLPFLGIGQVGQKKFGVMLEPSMR